MCSKGYPDEFKKNVEIENLNNLKLSDHEYIFHAGTLEKDKKLYAIGGRVLNFVVTSDNFSEAKNKILLNLDKLNWQGGFYRKDIGYKVID
jgi:phosphoribosylamine--glycine ligase